MKKSLSKDNRGLTLTELLVGVVILAIVTVPLLHVFVTGASTERKSRVYGDATAAAQNLLEQAQASDIDAIFANSLTLDGAHFYRYDSGSSSYALATPSSTTSAVPETGVSSTYYLGIPGYQYGSSSFDAMMTLTLDEGDAINSTPVSVSNQISAYLDMTTADTQAVSALKNECGSLVSSPDLLSARDLSRSIQMKIAAVSGQPNLYTVTVEFNYTASIPYTVTDSQGAVINKTYAFSNAESSSASVDVSSLSTAPGNALFSVFLFFDGYYRTDSNFTGDSIAITNTDASGALVSRDVNVFVVNTSTGSLPTNYIKTLIWYKYQSFSAANKPVNHLVLTNLPKGNVTYRASKNYWERTTLEVTGYLVEKTLLNRKFKVAVAFYPAGSGFSGEPVLSIDSTKLS